MNDFWDIDFARRVCEAISKKALIYFVQGNKDFEDSSVD